MGLIRFMADEMAKEIGNKTREFYEFVLPPVDMRLDDDKLYVIIDIPGFAKDDIKLTLEDSMISIQACKKIPEKDNGIICNQRPNVIDKKLRLPIELGADQVSSAKYEQGILTVTIPVKKSGQDIKIE